MFRRFVQIGRVSTPIRQATVPMYLFAQQSMFANTRLRYPCIVETDEQRERRLCAEKTTALEQNKKLERELCKARSVIARMQSQINAEPAAQSQMSDRLAQHIKEQLRRQRQHRKAEHQLAIKETTEVLSAIKQRIPDASTRYDELRAEEKKLAERLRHLQAIDLNSDDFLDRETSMPSGDKSVQRRPRAGK